MIALMQADRERQPLLFFNFGPIDPEVLDRWLRERNLDIPDDLRELWCATGGCDIFESETILGPSGDPYLGDEVEGANEWYREQGMPARYLALCSGFDGLLVLDLPTGTYLRIAESSYEVYGTHDSLADWYQNVIRAEFAARYGLE